MAYAASPNRNTISFNRLTLVTTQAIVLGDAHDDEQLEVRVGIQTVQERLGWQQVQSGPQDQGAQAGKAGQGCRQRTRIITPAYQYKVLESREPARTHNAQRFGEIYRRSIVLGIVRPPVLTCASPQAQSLYNGVCYRQLVTDSLLQTASYRQPVTDSMLQTACNRQRVRDSLLGF
ncbi:hypothetical protein FOCC_FOCC015236 [Frankliniella occidentalis]|nr:hypothetical protein FOCC_FOCC015236 [Frankliniella occidentalis]